MIYTIGYEHLAPADLAAIATKLNARVIDVRSRPSGRVKRGFSRLDLQRFLEAQGGSYDWRGFELGGRGLGVLASGLDYLAARADDSGMLERNLLLLCQESAPGDCHRHHRIALPLAARGVPVVHLYNVLDRDESEAFTATALQRALDDADPDAAYDCVTVAELLAGEMPPA